MISKVAAEICIYAEALLAGLLNLVKVLLGYKLVKHPLWDKIGCKAYWPFI